MAKLSRLTGKVFAGDTALTNLGIFGSAKAGDPTNPTASNIEAQIQSPSAYDEGWTDAVVTSKNFPPIEEVNGVLRTISYQNCYLLQEGIPEYDIGTEYSNTSIVKSISGQSLSFYISLKDNNMGNPLSDGTSWIKANLNSARNIGEIITSAIPLNDAGVHLLDGALLDGTGAYKAFFDYIASIYNSSLNYFCTEVEWQTSVTTYGSCGKFVYDSVNKTVRLPKVSDILQGTTDATALGNLVQAGLPNITGTIDGRSAKTEYEVLGEMYPDRTSITGAFEGLWGYQNSTSDSQAGNMLRGFNFDASRSNSIYGNSTTVQPQTIKVLYYIVLANSEKTDIEVDIDEIATDLNGKMDVDFSNMNATSTAKDVIVDWGMPDYSAGISISSGYTATSNGYIYIKSSANNSNANDTAYIDGVEIYSFKHNDGYAMNCGGVVPIPKSATFTTNSNRWDALKFYPCKGR